MYKKLLKKLLASYVLLALVFSYALMEPTIINAAQTLGSQAQVQLSDSRPSQTAVTYTATYVAGQTATLKCINIVFATNADMSGGVPSGMSTTSSVFGSVSGTGLTSAHWSLYNTANGTLQFEDSNTDSLSTGNYATASATTITNPSGSTFYAQITSYTALATHVCSTVADQSNIIALSTLSGVSTTVTVSPTLTLTISNDGGAINGSGDTSPVTTTATTIPFGTVAAAATAWGSQTATISTNAANGYGLYLRDTGTLKDTNNDLLTDQTGTVSSPNSYSGSGSASSFGFTLGGTNAIVMGSNKWAGLGSAGTQYLIGTKNAAVNADTINIEYKVEPSNTQPPGTYSTTVIYTAVPSY